MSDIEAYDARVRAIRAYNQGSMSRVVCKRAGMFDFFNRLSILHDSCTLKYLNFAQMSGTMLITGCNGANRCKTA